MPGFMKLKQALQRLEQIKKKTGKSKKKPMLNVKQRKEMRRNTPERMESLHRRDKQYLDEMGSY